MSELFELIPLKSRLLEYLRKRRLYGDREQELGTPFFCETFSLAQGVKYQLQCGHYLSMFRSRGWFRPFVATFAGACVMTFNIFPGQAT